MSARVRELADQITLHTENITGARHAIDMAADAYPGGLGDRDAMVMVLAQLHLIKTEVERINALSAEIFREAGK